jgi:ribosomal protein S18 acetylase RimI-like enzyme
MRQRSRGGAVVGSSRFRINPWGASWPNSRSPKFPQHPRQGHRRRLRGIERPGCTIPDPTEATRLRDPVLYPRPRRAPDRGRTSDRPVRRLVCVASVISQVPDGHYGFELRTIERQHLRLANSSGSTSPKSSHASTAAHPASRSSTWRCMTTPMTRWSRQLGPFILALSEQSPVGCAGLRVLEDRLGELKRVYVRPSARGRGLGTALITALENYARSRNLTTLRLDTRDELDEAMRTYERHG